MGTHDDENDSTEDDIENYPENPALAGDGWPNPALHDAVLDVPLDEEDTSTTAPPTSASPLIADDETESAPPTSASPLIADDETEIAEEQVFADDEPEIAEEFPDQAPATREAATQHGNQHGLCAIM